MDDATKQAFLSAVRSLLVVSGAWLASHHYLDAGSVDQVVGAVMIIIPIVWGVWDKYRSEQATKARESIALNAGIAVADATPGKTPLVSAEHAPAVLAAVASIVPAAVQTGPVPDIVKPLLASPQSAPAASVAQPLGKGVAKP